jgi:formate/nitrite transporter
MLKHWTITFLGNLAGSLFVMAILIGYADILSDAAYASQTIKFATKKVVAPQWHQIFLRGIGANWLVCLACFLACSAREQVSKIISIWWPCFAFVILAFDHVVANMFYIPIAIFLGAPEISVGLYIWKSMIPALLGNIVGGGLFVGVVYWYLYLSGKDTVVIDGTSYGGPPMTLFGVSADVEELPSQQSRRESDKTTIV